MKRLGIEPAPVERKSDAVTITPPSHQDMKVSMPPVLLNNEMIQRVDMFKLLGVHISNDLKWGQHVNIISSKAASRLYFLKQLKRAGAGTVLL